MYILIFNVDHCNNVPFTFWNILPDFVCLHDERNICKTSNREQLSNERTIVKIDTFSEDIDFCHPWDLHQLFVNCVME